MIPTLDEISTKLANAKYFTVLDLKHGFQQIELSPESRELCTFSSPMGTFCYNRLPFGISSAPEEFQKQNSEIFSGENSIVFIDDLLVFGKTKQEHDESLEIVLDKAEKNNVRFNPVKLQYCVREVTYLGHKFSEKGVQPDEKRLEAIKQINDPTCKKDLQKFMGIINYLRPFVPNMAALTFPLRDLLKNDILYQWSQSHSEAIFKIKDAIYQFKNSKTF